MPRWLLPTLIITATALFVVGVAIERGSHDEHAETASATVHESEGSGTEGGEESHGEAQATRGESSEDTLFGLDLESIPLVALAAIASLALALVAWQRPRLGILLVFVAVALIAFAALDIREVFHQLDADKAGLAALPGLVALLHLTAAGVAGVANRSVTS